MGFPRCHPKVPEALFTAIGLFGWLRRDPGGPAPCGVAWGAACAQAFLLLPEKPAATSSEEKPHGVPEVPERMCCLTCGQVFGSREEQVSGACTALLQSLSPSAVQPSAGCFLELHCPRPLGIWHSAPCVLSLKMLFTGGKWYLQHRSAPVQVNCYVANSLTYPSSSQDHCRVMASV